MARQDAGKDKISPEFAARLDRLGPREKVRAIVLLRQDVGELPARRQSRVQRQATIAAIRKSSEQALRDIEGILERYGGKRLAADVDALGCLPIETTASGISALAALEHVKAILEDQPILGFPRPKHL